MKLSDFIKTFDWSCLSINVKICLPRVIVPNN